MYFADHSDIAYVFPLVWITSYSNCITLHAVKTGEVKDVWVVYVVSL